MAETVTAQQAVDLIGRSYHRVIPERMRSEVFWQREKQHVLTLLARDPKLAGADPDSLARAVANAGAMGLSLNPVLGHCYLIPRRQRARKEGEKWADYEAQVPFVVSATPSYMGMVDLAVKSERIVQVVAEVVFDADTFRYHGPMQAPTHEAVHRSVDRTYEKAVGVYACARLRERRTLAPDGAYQSVYIDRDMVLRIRALSERPDSLMWSESGMWTEGWKKAAVRRLWKLIPKSQAMIEAMRVLDEAEGRVDEVVEPPPEKAVVLVSDADAEALVQQLRDGGVPEDKLAHWTDRVALRFQVTTLAELPKDELPKARKLIAEALASRAAAGKAQG